MKKTDFHKICPICGIDMAAKLGRRPSELRKRKTCSVRCSVLLRWGTDTEELNFTCVICGLRKHVTPVFAVNRKVCSEPCRRQWLSIRARGSNGNNWKGGITQIGRYLYASKPFRAWAKQILASHHGTCVDCGDDATEAHHLVTVASLLAKMLDPENGVALCDGCHKTRHAKPHSSVRPPSN
jgi:hypothetical protein